MDDAVHGWGCHHTPDDHDCGDGDDDGSGCDDGGDYGDDGDDDDDGGGEYGGDGVDYVSPFTSLGYSIVQFMHTWKHLSKNS